MSSSVRSASAPSMRSLRSAGARDDEESVAPPQSKRCRTAEPSRRPVLPSSRRQAASASAEHEEPPARRRRASGTPAAPSLSAAAKIPRVRLVMRSSCPPSATTGTSSFSSRPPLLSVFHARLISSHKPLLEALVMVPLLAPARLAVLGANRARMVNTTRPRCVQRRLERKSTPVCRGKLGLPMPPIRLPESHL